jgi:phosphatidylglycerol lysyltransferase
VSTAHAAPGKDAHLGLRAWVSPRGTGSLFYAGVKGYRVVAGEPRASSSLKDLFREFEEESSRAGLRVVYFGLPVSAAEALDPAGRRGRWHAGDLPVFHLARWRDESTMPPAIRSQARRARNSGVTVRRLPAAPGPGDPTGPALRACLRSWLSEKPLPPMRFVTSPFLFDPWPEQGVFVAERRGNVEGFLVPSLSLFPGIWRVDAVARTALAPNGCAELLVAEAFRHAGENGHERATLGLAPLSRRAAVRPAHWMDRLAEIVREAGVPGYSFEGLEAFKAKFRPDEWRPLYCVSGGGRLALRDMTAVARAFAGSSLIAYAARALAWRWTRRSFAIPPSRTRGRTR